MRRFSTEKRKVSACIARGKEGRNIRNRICENFIERVTVPRVNIETPRDSILPVLNAPKIGENNDEHDEENEVLLEDEVLDAFDVDNGLAYDEQTDINWTEADFDDAGDIPPFGHECCANIIKMHQNSCTSCLESLTCLNDVECMQPFLTATNYFG